MKRIQDIPDVEPMNTDSAYAAHKLYRVHLGNHRTVQFTSRRLALAYAADTLRWINEVMLESNTLLGEALQDYRMAWPILQDVKDAELQGNDARIREQLDQATWHLDKASAKGSRTEGLYHGWRHVGLALSTVANAYERLEALYRYKTQGVLRWRMAMRRRQCLDALERMTNYADNTPHQAESVSGTLAPSAR